MTRSEGIDYGRPIVTEADGPVASRFWEGPEDLTFVCLHGIFSSAAEWSVVAGQLRRWGRVVAPDLPGFGRTPLRGRTGLEAMQRAVAAVIDHVCPKGPVVLVATSMGAAVAARQSAADPDRTVAMVVGSGYLPPYFGGWRAPLVVTAMLAQQVGNIGAAVRRELLFSALGLQSPEKALVSGDTLPEGHADGASGLPGRAWAGVRALAPLTLMATVPPLAHQSYARVRCPVLLLHGLEDAMVPPGWAYHAAQRHHFSLRMLPAVAHVVKLGNPAWWSAEVGAWLVRQGLLGDDQLDEHAISMAQVENGAKDLQVDN